MDPSELLETAKQFAADHPHVAAVSAGAAVVYLFRDKLVAAPIRWLVQKNPRPPYKEVHGRGAWRKAHG